MRSELHLYVFVLSICNRQNCNAEDIIFIKCRVKHTNKKLSIKILIKVIFESFNSFYILLKYA